MKVNVVSGCAAMLITQKTLIHVHETETETSCILVEVIQLTPVGITDDETKQSDSDAKENKAGKCDETRKTKINSHFYNSIEIILFIVSCEGLLN